MKNKLSIILISIICLTTSICSCSKDDENEVMNSTSRSNESHKSGYNCMSCHKSGGSGEGVFKTAGTVYNETLTNTNSTATINIYTGPNGTGTLKKSIEADVYGNFYTTSSIDFGAGLYVSVQGATTTKYMTSSIITGQCNSCHGSSTSKIWTK